MTGKRRWLGLRVWGADADGAEGTRWGFAEDGDKMRRPELGNDTEYRRGANSS
jgi:hypothetical protein